MTEPMRPKVWGEGGRELVHDLREAGLTKPRIFGGLACWLHCPETRAYFIRSKNSDLDLFSESSLKQTAFEAVIRPRGFRRTDRETFIGGRVLEYKGEIETAELSVDLYVGSLVFSHEIPFKRRLIADWPTLPLAELLATKLQVHDPQQKDLLDIVMLMAEHGLGQGDDEQINVPVVTRMCAEDWGLWVEMRRNLIRSLGCLPSTGLPADVRERTKTRLTELSRELSGIKGSMRWRMRALAGERVKYWNDVQEWRS